MLRAIAAGGEGIGVIGKELARQFGDGLSTAILQLKQRDAIAPNWGGYQFQVEMIRRWFAREMAS